MGSALSCPEVSAQLSESAANKNQAHGLTVAKALDSMGGACVHSPWARTDFENLKVN